MKHELKNTIPSKLQLKSKRINVLPGIYKIKDICDFIKNYVNEYNVVFNLAKNKIVFIQVLCYYE